MSIYVISDHYYAMTKFHHNPQLIDQVKAKNEGGGLQPPKPFPWIFPCSHVTAILLPLITKRLDLTDHTSLQQHYPTQLTASFHSFYSA